MGIFFEPKPAPLAGEPELVDALADAYESPAVGSEETAFNHASERVASLAGSYPLIDTPEFRENCTNLFTYAFRSPPLLRAQARQQAARGVSLIGRESGQQFQVGRFIAAVIIFAAVAGAALGADAAGLGDSSKALYGFAASILGVIVGVLGGESGKG
jgi:hypothetical protein